MAGGFLMSSMNSFNDLAAANSFAKIETQTRQTEYSAETNGHSNVAVILPTVAVPTVAVPTVAVSNGVRCQR
jgi:hypothetical protein